MNLRYRYRNVSEPNVVSEGFKEFQMNFVDTLTHFPVSLFLIGLYILKIYRKQTAHLSPFLSFHILMYASVIINIYTISMKPGISVFLNVLLFWILTLFYLFNYIILSHIFIDLFVVVFQVTNVYFKTCDIHITRRNIKCVLIVVLIVFRLVFLSDYLVLSISDWEINLDFSNGSIHLINILLLIILIIQWKISGIHQKDSFILINSIIMLLLITIFQVITIFKHVLKYNSDLPLSFDKFIYNVYYFPYLWIISVYICNFKTVQTWIQNQRKRTSITAVVPESLIVVRPQRIDETVVSNLSVSELETVM
ncbi:hypothetical protein CRE_02337 [Caenorhabditis remanei]|uniref:Uncharacterized protein n=1 Tax=Caenorhabditis remanei TaxID=31234 RepID=E3MIJ3_CAERE|nr:hypothetical protein CRE_02337 [Caenorhabditis remanei]